MSETSKPAERQSLMDRAVAAREHSQALVAEREAGTDPLSTLTELVAELRTQLDTARAKIANLEKALETSRHIGQAVGIVMARRNATAEDAFAALVAASQRSHRKVREVADEVVLTGALPEAA